MSGSRAMSCRSISVSSMVADGTAGGLFTPVRTIGTGANPPGDGSFRVGSMIGRKVRISRPLAEV